MRGRAQFVGNAGQHYVAYCLSVRGIHAALTFGNAPDVDIIVSKSDGSRSLSLQVKTSRWAHRSKRYGAELREWDSGSGCVGRHSPNLWFAFVDLQESDAGWSPLVFIVPSLWVGSFAKDDWSRKLFMLRAELWPLTQERWEYIDKFFENESDVVAWCSEIPEHANVWWY